MARRALIVPFPGWARASPSGWNRLAISIRVHIMEYRGLTLTSENVSCVNEVFVMEVDDVVKTKESFGDFFL